MQRELTTGSCPVMGWDVRAYARDMCDRGRDPAPEGYFLYHSPAATVPKAFYEYDRWNPPP